MTEEEKKQMEDLKKENQDLKDSNVALKNANVTLEDQAKVLKEKEAEATVDAAIAAKKLHPDQKEASLLMCKKDPEGFAAMMEKAVPMVQVPGNDMFDNSQQGGGNAPKYDVLKLGGIEQ